MFKRDYFLLALKAGLYQYKRWILEAFAVTDLKPHDEYNHRLVRVEDGRYGVYDRETGQTTPIVDAMPDEPLFSPLEAVALKAGDMENVSQALKTTYGNALVNQMILCYPFGAKIGFVTGPIAIGPIEKVIQKRWDDDMPEEEAASLPPEKQPIRTAEYHRFNEAVGQFPGLTQLCVPSATPKTMTADPRMIQRRDELLEKHKHELHDQVVLSKILAELVAMDKEWMKDDPGERFYIKGKSYDVVRLKVFIMQGVSTGFGEAADIITSSLDEGWDIEKLPAMVNQLRDGSFSRGAQTALGGVEVKFNYRIFQNSTVIDEDCGTKRGLRYTITKDNARHFESNYQIVKGQSVLLTEEVLKGLVGKEIQVRSPIYCRSSGANFCRYCVGEEIAKTPQALSTYAAGLGSSMMLAFMSAMHGKSLRTEKIDLEETLS